MLDKFVEKKISNFIIGVDEVGRGPLAGPVVSAAVILSEDFDTNDINDSKKLSKSKRELIYEQIINKCDFKIGIASVDEIDKYNILQASLLSMQRAVSQFKSKDHYTVLVDGPWSYDNSNSLIIPKIKGDSIYPSIAAASIIAKVYRDNLMMQFDKKYPDFYFSSHKGYGTKLHKAAIKKHGITPIHRKTFKGVIA